MLVLSRKSGESIQLSGDIRITVIGISGHRVRIGIEAPDDVRILRGELPNWSRNTNRPPYVEPAGVAGSHLLTE